MSLSSQCNCLGWLAPFRSSYHYHSRCRLSWPTGIDKLHNGHSPQHLVYVASLRWLRLVGSRSNFASSHWFPGTHCPLSSSLIEYPWHPGKTSDQAPFQLQSKLAKLNGIIFVAKVFQRHYAVYGLQYHNIKSTGLKVGFRCIKFSKLTLFLYVWYLRSTYNNLISILVAKR